MTMSQYDNLKMHQHVALNFVRGTKPVDFYYVGKNSKGEYLFHSTNWLTSAKPFNFSAEELDRFIVHVFNEMPKPRSRFSVVKWFLPNELVHPFRIPKSVKAFRKNPWSVL